MINAAGYLIIFDDIMVSVLIILVQFVAYIKDLIYQEAIRHYY